MVLGLSKVPKTGTILTSSESSGMHVIEPCITKSPNDEMKLYLGSAQ